MHPISFIRVLSFNLISSYLSKPWKFLQIRSSQGWTSSEGSTCTALILLALKSVFFFYQGTIRDPGHMDPNFSLAGMMYFGFA